MSSLTTVFCLSQNDQLSNFTGQITFLGIINATSAGMQQLNLLPQRLFIDLQDVSFGSDQPSAYSDLAELIRSGSIIQLKNISLYFSTNWTIASSISDVTNAISLTCSSLYKFQVQSCHFNPTNVLPLCAYISSPNCMSNLVLCGNNSFEADSLQLLISSLPCTKSLVSLNISYNKLSLQDTELLSAALAANSSLTYLNLSACAIGGTGTEVIADALEENKVLQTLVLFCNNINTRGAAALASMLTVNTSLKVLNLAGNPAIGTEGAIKLIYALEQNKSLETLHLPSSCEPIEFGSVLMDDIRKSGRVSLSIA